jgi:hypothetical protein
MSGRIAFSFTIGHHEWEGTQPVSWTKVSVQLSFYQKCPEQPVQAAFSIDFLVVGGGLAGLACAIALSRVGHRVLVLEQDIEDEQVGHSLVGCLHLISFLQDSRGCRLPPNVTKILFHWGLQEKLRSIAVASNAITFHLCPPSPFDCPCFLLLTYFAFSRNGGTFRNTCMGSRNDRGSRRRVCFLTRKLFNLLGVSCSLMSSQACLV